jgi:predicted nucleic acid-binding protein
MSESGSEWVMMQCEPAAGNTVIISYATLAEAVTTFSRKARAQDLNQRISESERDHHIQLFRRDAERQYTLVRVTKAVYTQAGDLSRIYKLRAYDAIQLVCALQANIKIAAPEGIVLTFVSADVDLLNVAEAEGLDIQNPNAYS